MKAGRDAEQAAEPEQLQLWSPRETRPGWHLRLSRRARRMSLRVFPGGRVEVVVPPGLGMHAIQRFVSRHREWAERRSRELELQAPHAGTRRPDAVHLPLLERQWAVTYVTGARREAAETDEGGLRVRVPAIDDRHVGHALQRWLLRRAGPELGARLQAVAEDTGIDYRRLQLRRQRTRWGSCSSTGTISLNVCLMFQRPEVVRYLMVHELCHRRHMNHSQRFWRLVENHEPEWRRLDAELLRGWRHVPGWVFP